MSIRDQAREGKCALFGLRTLMNTLRIFRHSTRCLDSGRSRQSGKLLAGRSQGLASRALS